MLAEEGLRGGFARHQRHAAATTRAAVRAWGPEVPCADEREHPGSFAAVSLPGGVEAALEVLREDVA
jgi:alanine-glyoxylate transaminase / serine-glyoxylate transaminase / serine-pyruvate transaminase